MSGKDGGIHQDDQGYETFDDLVPSNTGDNFESFDDLNYDLNQPEEEESGKEADKAGEEKGVSKNSPVNQLDDKEDTGESKKEVSKKESKDVKEKNKEQQEYSPAPQKGENPAPTASGKTIKTFLDGKMYEIPEDAKTKVKVSSKGEMVSIAELKKDYSARKAWDKKFKELEDHEASYKQERAQYDKEKNYLIDNIKKAKELVSDSLKENTDPMKGINYLLDLMRVDSYNFNKGLMNYMAEQVRVLDDMTESEREAYWLRKENEYIKSQKDNLADQSQKSDQRKQLIEKIDSLREQNGVSKEAFASAYNQLNEMGEGNPTPERVVRYAKLEPLVETASKLVGPYEDQIDDDGLAKLISTIANSMADDPEITEEDVQQQLAETFEVEGLTDTINEKLEREAPRGPKVEDSTSKDELESFDDFDYY